MSIKLKELDIIDGRYPSGWYPTGIKEATEIINNLEDSDRLKLEKLRKLAYSKKGTGAPFRIGKGYSEPKYQILESIEKNTDAFKKVKTSVLERVKVYNQYKNEKVSFFDFKSKKFRKQIMKEKTTKSDYKWIYRDIDKDVL